MTSVSDPQPTSGSVHRSKGDRRPNPRILIPIVLLVGAGITFWFYSTRPKSTALAVTGRIEGYETDIGAKTPGRVDMVAVREGDRVQQGQIIVRLDDDEIQAQLRGAEARLKTAQEQEQQALLQITVVQSQIQEAELTLQQSQGDAQGRVTQAQANVSAVRAQRAQAEAQAIQAASEAKLARTNRDRVAQLRREGAVAQQQLDQAQTAFETALAIVEARRAAVQAADEQLSAAQGNLTQVESTGFNPGIRTAQLQALNTRLIQAQSQLDAARSEVASARAAKQQVQAQIQYLNIISPIDGVVTARSVEPGAVVTSGKTLLTVINPNDVYLRGYVPDADIGRIKIGQKARVYLDSDLKRETPLEGEVTAIDTQASFTPENIYFQKDRVKQVFGIKIRINQPGGFAKPGLPADAEILAGSESGR
ncbi:hypothetical protein BST81_08305 [Leptolyngbya sp. 'hensonii']|uniref:HlyD family secretion protein n=1 Tax=Leptolyngbya sp. 'hensonii' TaxID=1922337 RepID=UPI00094F972F|nr:HlyD family efflux transporter periplasmic adaptor subunit [Leptolyngbya sp. 'hensonii']OLP18907.1 hypothetical protein BST81_08305 [Leptolyngbya sp. 'hensonii']